MSTAWKDAPPEPYRLARIVSIMFFAILLSFSVIFDIVWLSGSYLYRFLIMIPGAAAVVFCAIWVRGIVVPRHARAAVRAIMSKHSSARATIDVLTAIGMAAALLASLGWWKAMLLPYPILALRYLFMAATFGSRGDSALI